MRRVRAVHCAWHQGGPWPNAALYYGRLLICCDPKCFVFLTPVYLDPADAPAGHEAKSKRKGMR